MLLTSVVRLELENMHKSQVASQTGELEIRTVEEFIYGHDKVFIICNVNDIAPTLTVRLMV